MKANTTAGQLLKTARMKKGLTQYDVAKKSGIHPNTYAKIERDVQKAKFPTIKELAKVLDLNLKDIPT